MHSPKGRNGQGCTRLKPGARSSFQVSRVIPYFQGACVVTQHVKAPLTQAPVQFLTTPLLIQLCVLLDVVEERSYTLVPVNPCGNLQGFLASDINITQLCCRVNSQMKESPHLFIKMHIFLDSCIMVQHFNSTISDSSIPFGR